MLKDIFGYSPILNFSKKLIHGIISDLFESISESFLFNLFGIDITQKLSLLSRIVPICSIFNSFEYLSNTLND